MRNISEITLNLASSSGEILFEDFMIFSSDEINFGRNRVTDDGAHKSGWTSQILYMGESSKFRKS